MRGPVWGVKKWNGRTLAAIVSPAGLRWPGMALLFGAGFADPDGGFFKAVLEMGAPTSSVGRGVRALSPDTRCGPPGLRSFEAACAPPSMAPLASYACSQGTGIPPGISCRDEIKEWQARRLGCRRCGGAVAPWLRPFRPLACNGQGWHCKLPLRVSVTCSPAWMPALWRSGRTLAATVSPAGLQWPGMALQAAVTRQRNVQ